MCMKSIEGLVSLLEEEEAAEARRRPKIIKLPDPTIYTITSPSQWQRNKLKSPDIESPPSFPPDPPPLIQGEIIDLDLSPPQDVPDISDHVNSLPRTPIKKFNADFELSEANLNIVNLQTSPEQPHIDVSNIRPSQPQPPEIELVDVFKEPTFKMKQLEEIVKDEVVSVPLFLHKSFPPTESYGASNIFSLLRLLHSIIFISTF